MAFPSLLTNAIAQDPDILDLDLHDVARLEKDGRLTCETNTAGVPDFESATSSSGVRKRCFR